MRAISKKNLWNAVPPSLKSLAGAVVGRVPQGVLLGRRFRKTLRFVEEAQWWPAERTRSYQLGQLRQTSMVAYEKTRFYREMFDSIGFSPQELRSPEDIACLPTIDKNTLRESLDDMCSVSPNSRGVDRVSTGGSSGDPLRFYMGSQRSAIEYAYLVASWRRMGYALSIPQAVFRGEVVPEDRTGLRHSYDPILRRHYYSSFHMTDHNIHRYLEHVRTIGPCFLHVYPSSGTALARYLSHRGGRRPENILGILAESEMVLREDRQVIEDAFNVRFSSSYGHSEKLVLATECEGSTNYHVWPTYGYFELVDAEGRRVTEAGRRGEIVGTGFINRVVPFIRYRTGDYARFVGDACRTCGREHPVVDEIEGRWPQGGLASWDGSTISMTAFNVHDDTFQNTMGYQFHQTVPGKATLRIVPSKTLNEAEKAEILSGATKRLQGQVELRLEIRKSLECTLQGKQLRVVSRIQDRSGGRT